MLRPFAFRSCRSRPSPRPRSRLEYTPLILGLVAIALTANAASAELHPNTRDGWYVGLAFGGGSAQLTQDGSSSDREGGDAGSVRAGYAFSPEFGAGVEGNMWFKTSGGVDFTLSTFTASLSYYPGRSGLMLRGGIGGGQAEAEITDGSTTVTATESGFGVSLGAAYDFRILRTFSLGPQFDYAYLNVDSFDANYFNLGLALNWYFIPK